MQSNRGNMTTPSDPARRLRWRNAPVGWGAFWGGTMVLLWIWLLLYLNAPARQQYQSAVMTTFLGAAGVVAFSFVLGWGCALVLHMWDRPGRRWAYFLVTFVLNLLRSIPQIIGMLLGYVLLTGLIRSETLRSPSLQLALIAAMTALFLFHEVTDLIRERIQHHLRLDFVNALRVLGVKESRIINREILLKNCGAHLLQKAVAQFGTALFLVCSIDYVISVGLSTDVNLANFPVTLGSMLARMDSKQDILMIGASLTDPSLLAGIPFQHLQGTSVAFTIVFTLYCAYQISNALVERHRL
jgi:ABC-type methionine transport system permease subunit